MFYKKDNEFYLSENYKYHRSKLDGVLLQMNINKNKRGKERLLSRRVLTRFSRRISVEYKASRRVLTTKECVDLVVPLIFEEEDINLFYQAIWTNDGIRKIIISHIETSRRKLKR